MYNAGKSRFEITEPGGVDEFMFFLEGSVTLTQTMVVMTINEAAVTIPRNGRVYGKPRVIERFGDLFRVG